MTRHEAREARMLGLWTAGWLGGLLLAGLLWVGDLSLQWPVLLVPVVWALVAVRPRGGRRQDPAGPPPDLGHRTDTVERPALRPPDRDRY
jgi:hypothetical protein